MIAPKEVLQLAKNIQKEAPANFVPPSKGFDLKVRMSFHIRWCWEREVILKKLYFKLTVVMKMDGLMHVP